MNDIVKIKRYLTILNEEYPNHKKDVAMEGAIKLFSTLISENKELKEENNLLKSKLNVWENLKNEDFIPKSKVEEKIEELEKDENLINAEYFIKVLQPLLGKE